METYISYMRNPEHVRQFLIALIKQDYEINDHIPNASEFLYKMFHRPLTKHQEILIDSKGKKLGTNNLLADRLFVIDG